MSPHKAEIRRLKDEIEETSQNEHTHNENAVDMFCPTCIHLDLLKAKLQAYNQALKTQLKIINDFDINNFRCQYCKGIFEVDWSCDTYKHNLEIKKELTSQIKEAIKEGEK